MSTLDQLFGIDIRATIVGVVAILIAIKTVVSFGEWVMSKLGIETKGMREKRESRQLLSDTASRLKLTEEKEKKDAETLYQRDMELQKFMTDNFTELSQTVKELKDEIVAMKEQTNRDKLAEYKDTLSTAYREYNSRKYSEEDPVPYWNSMEKEAFEGLITQYEDHGGVNSFVHSVLAVNIPLFKIVPLDFKKE